MRRENIDLTGTGVAGTSERLRGILMRPDEPGPRAGVVVVFEAFGVDDEQVKHTARMARQGYLALMPDLFADGGMRACIRATMTSLATGKGRAVQDILAARQWLVDSPDCTGKVGIIGFCMGGGFAIVTANQGFEVASSNYGRLPKDLDAAATGACPLIGSYGGKDFSLPGAGQKLAAAWSKAGVEHDVKVYPTGGHQFLNEDYNGPKPLRFLGRFIPGIGPDPEIAADAWARIDDFFAEHLS